MIRPRRAIEQLGAYRLIREAPVRLNQNESPLDWPDEMKADVLARLARRPWHRYPPADGGLLREALGREAGVAPEMIAVTNGSNEAILAVIQAFATGRPVVLTAPGYSLSRTLVLVGGAEARPVMLREDFSLDAPAVLREIAASGAAMVYLTSPNNPTGNRFARRDLEAVLDGAQVPVVVDEAYVQFGGDSLVAALGRYPHLVVLRTFSKAFALAGARIGWVVAREEVVAAVSKTLPPYTVNLFAQEAALAALERGDLVAERVRLIVRERERVARALSRLEDVVPFPSETNFILFRTPWPAAMVFERLLGDGVLVRDVSGQPLLDRCLRVTIGTPEDNDRFLGALARALEDLR
ncbi:MAG: histidinol-phosphate transaminase [Armatimonadota bacterium]|nr:histidinol-phosphate transaminase [Armatimonadota bacterium]MDR7450656.1 histidinol-phosphate transaminase [Armatimonadota bacterium]MDR7466211.1 histidinol-phosphate transaminase [Armatimonadota bacterium]MDR7492932.1 histidinol-phosphate transaminase [Armatimonadota bacterium]MDR7498311.1 histidinol-phosphate transaminase [Armatimonadota bacterium]